MMSKRMTALLVLCFSIISVSTTLTHPKIYVRKSPSLISKTTDLGLCATMAASTGFCVLTIVRYLTLLVIDAKHCMKNEAEDRYFQALGAGSLACLAATALYCKNQWQVQEYIEVENQ